MTTDRINTEMSQLKLTATDVSRTSCSRPAIQNDPALQSLLQGGNTSAAEIDDSFWPWHWRANSTTPSSICGLTRTRSAPGFSIPRRRRRDETCDRALLQHQNDWLVREIIHYLKRVLKRLEVKLALAVRVHRTRLMFHAHYWNWRWLRTAAIC